MVNVTWLLDVDGTEQGGLAPYHVTHPCAKAHYFHSYNSYSAQAMAASSLTFPIISWQPELLMAAGPMSGFMHLNTAFGVRMRIPMGSDLDEHLLGCAPPTASLALQIGEFHQRSLAAS